MKKIFSITGLAAMAGFVFLPMNLSAGGYGAAGCGLGSVVIGSKPGIMQVFAATTNATFGSQTFGITTGTSNCGSGLLSYEMEQNSYMANNFESVQQDIAAGQGEKLNNLAFLMGCSSDSMGKFSSVTQANYDQIFNTNEEQAPEYVLYRIKQAVKSDTDLASSCNYVRL